MKEDKIVKLVEKKIRAIKYAFYVQQQKSFKAEKAKIHEEYTNKLNMLAIKEAEALKYEQILEQPVSEEFRLQIEQQVKAELGLVKEEPKSLLTAEQEAQLAQLIEQGESGNVKEKFF